MAVSPQDKLLYVANKLGLSTLKDMQATTRCIFDTMPVASSSFSFFKDASQRNFPATNVDDNQFEANEALLIQSIGFFIPNTTPTTGTGISTGLLDSFPQKYVVRYEVQIGNKIVLKDNVTFDGIDFSYKIGSSSAGNNVNWLDLEAVGLVIPPLVDYQVNVTIYDVNADAFGNTLGDKQLACYLYGTGVLLNFNTSL
jgi:hypothetical protein